MWVRISRCILQTRIKLATNAAAPQTRRKRAANAPQMRRKRAANALQPSYSAGCVGLEGNLILPLSPMLPSVTLCMIVTSAMRVRASSDAVSVRGGYNKSFTSSLIVY